MSLLVRARLAALCLSMALAATTGRAVDPMGTAQGVTALAHLRLDSLVGGPLYVVDLWAHDHPDGHRYVYLTTQADGMFVIDVTDPGAPVVVTRYLFPGWEWDRVNAVKLSGTWAFVALNDGGVSILDVSVPAAPVEVAHMSAPPFTGGTHTLWVDGNWLYAANLSTLAIVDVTNPASPVLRQIWTPSTRPFLVHDLTVFDGRAYVACVQAGLHILDVADPPNPVDICSFNYDSWMVTHSAWPNAARTHVLITDEQCNPADGIIHVADVRNLSAPVVTSTISLPATLDPELSMHQPFIANDVAYLAWYREGLRVYDLSNPAAPVELGRFATYDGGNDDYACYAGAYGVWADGCGLAYVADTGSGLWILKVDAVPQCAPQPVLLGGTFALATDACPWGGAMHDDGFAAPGETATLDAPVLNVGAAPATGLAVSVVASSPGIVAAAATGTVADVAPGTFQPASVAVDLSPTAECGSEQWVDLRIRTDQGTFVRRFTLRVGTPTVLLADDFSSDQGWTTSSSGIGTTGYWERVTPTGGRNGNPGVDDPRDAGTSCWVTGDGANVHVDRLVLDLVSPVMDLSGYDGAEVEWSDWLWRDWLWQQWLVQAEVLKDGALVDVLEGMTQDSLTWRRHSVLVPPQWLTSGVQIRFRAASLYSLPRLDAGVDDVRVTGWSCPRCAAAPLDVALDVAVDSCGAISDGVAQPGETIELRPLVTNRSDRTLAGARVAVLGTTGAWTALDAEVALPTLAPGASARPSPGLRVAIDPAAPCGMPLGVTLAGRTGDGDGAAATGQVVPGAVTLTQTVAFADDFDAALEGFAPPGWLVSTTDMPGNVATQVDASISPVGLSPGPATPPNAVRLGPADYPGGQRYDYDLSKDFDPRPWLAPGDVLRVSFDAWVHDFDAGDRFALRIVDGAGADVEAWSIADAGATIADNAYRWMHPVVDVDPSLVDLSTPLTFTFRASIDAAEGGGTVIYDAAYVDTFAVSVVHRDVACAPCVPVTTDLLYRLDVGALGPLDPGLFLDPPRGDGIALDVAPYAPMSGPGPDPLDPAVLTNGVPLSFYQVARPDGSPTIVRISKAAGTIHIDY